MKRKKNCRNQVVLASLNANASETTRFRNKNAPPASLPAGRFVVPPIHPINVGELKP
jgi:hypothetical protein